MKAFLATILVFPLGSCAVSNPCVIPGYSVEINMSRRIKKDLGIDVKSLPKPKMELLSIEPVTKVLAGQYANEDRANDMARFGKYSLSYEDYLFCTSAYSAVNLIIKYTYENQAKQKNVFIASSIVNDNECSIRFNGYIIVKREF